MNIRNVDDTLQRLVTNTNGVYGAPLIRQFTTSACNQLALCFDRLADLLKRRSDYAGMKRAEISKGRVIGAASRIDAWIDDRFTSKNRF